MVCSPAVCGRVLSAPAVAEEEDSLTVEEVRAPVSEVLFSEADWVPAHTWAKCLAEYFGLPAGDYGPVVLFPVYMSASERVWIPSAQ